MSANQGTAKARLFVCIAAALLIGVAGVGGFVGVLGALADDYTWTGYDHVTTDEWDSCFNWHPSLCAPGDYPTFTDDNATIPWAASAWPVDLVDDAIGDLTVRGYVSFGVVSSAQTLTVKNLHLENADDSDNNDLVMTMSAGGTIEIP